MCHNKPQDYRGMCCHQGLDPRGLNEWTGVSDTLSGMGGMQRLCCEKVSLVT